MFKKNVVFFATKLLGSILVGSIGTLTINTQVYGQTENETEASEMGNMTDMTAAIRPGETLPSMSVPGEKTFYVFTAEVENVDEEKLKIAGDSFDVKTLVANKGRQSYRQILITLTKSKQKDIRLL